MRLAAQASMHAADIAGERHEHSNVSEFGPEVLDDSLARLDKTSRTVDDKVELIATLETAQHLHHPLTPEFAKQVQGRFVRKMGHYPKEYPGSEANWEFQGMPYN